jgi:hypothetical protein
MRQISHRESDAILGAMRQVALAGGQPLTWADTTSVRAAGHYLLRRPDLSDIGALPAVEPHDLRGTGSRRTSRTCGARSTCRRLGTNRHPERSEESRAVASGDEVLRCRPMQLFGTAPGGMQLAKAKLGGVFNMGGAAVANYVSILEPLR